MKSMPGVLSTIKKGKSYTDVCHKGSLCVVHQLTSTVEEKYQKEPKHSNDRYEGKYDDDKDSSSDEDEDDEGFLATEALDAQISATLQAIRNKDPRVYDEKATFYAPIEEEEDEEVPPQKEAKPMYLQDYHRENLLNGYIGAEENEEVLVPHTFVQEQDELKKTIIKEMHAAANEDSSSSEDGDDDKDGGFLVPKMKPQLSKGGIHLSGVAKVEVDVTIADKDPETFLSNFMAARAWVPTDGARFQPLESDDEEEEERAEKFEAAYNLRFEDPQGSNEILRSYARDVVAARSVRREEPRGRKKQREAEREKKEAEKRQRGEERARLRKLKIEEMEEKLQKIKKVAGLKGQTLKDEEWVKFLDEGWDDSTWETEMNKRFGDDYYAQLEAGSEQDSETEKTKGSLYKKRKLKKPKWDDDIDITDIIPEFEDEEASRKKPVFTSFDSESESDEDESGSAARKSKSSKERKQDKLAKKKAARLERKKIEELVDNQLDFNDAILPKTSKQPSIFRYRETSPTSFGLTARDILMAPDASLNQFAGLKKLATFRDTEKKRKDKRKLGKKARLREWRRETFGNENGPEIIIGETATDIAVGPNLVEGKRRRKRSKKNKDQSSA